MKIPRIKRGGRNEKMDEYRLAGPGFDQVKPCPSDMAALSWAQGRLVRQGIDGTYKLDLVGPEFDEPIFTLEVQAKVITTIHVR